MKMQQQQQQQQQQQCDARCIRIAKQSQKAMMMFQQGAEMNAVVVLKQIIEALLDDTTTD
jgi:hypothetical protein